MRCLLSSFWLPKGGSSAEQYEDAFWPRRSGTRRQATGLRLAVADGASESMLSGLWADLLVRTWCRSPRGGMGEVVAAAMAGWDGTLAAYLADRDAQRRPIEWFEQPGLDRGAHATVLGVELGPAPGGGTRWSAVSLGDSCLFHVRGDALVTAFPLEESAAFSNAPKLVPTKAGSWDRVVAALDRSEGRLQRGDVLFLATDAVAAWFLAAAEGGGAPWRDLGRIERDDEAGFAAWAEGQRTRNRLRDDDLTVVRLEVG